MKGVVFTKFIEMVEEKFSIEVADEMIQRADVPSGGAYSAVGTYDHSEMVALLVALSELTNIPIPDLLRTYGRHLFWQFGKLYPSFLEGVASSIDFVASIENVIHVEVRKLYPDAQLPRFEVLEHSPDHLRVRYESERHLGPLALGLIESCIEYFKESGNVVVRMEPGADSTSPVVFVMDRLS